MIHTQETVHQRIAEKGHSYVYIVGYAGDPVNAYVDVMVQSSNKLPTLDYLYFIMDLYKPTLIRGADRELVYVDMFDKKGAIDLPHLMDSGKARYSNLFTTGSQM